LDAENNIYGIQLHPCSQFLQPIKPPFWSMDRRDALQLSWRRNIFRIRKRCFDAHISDKYQLQICVILQL
jgi:hypothetical protein